MHQQTSRDLHVDGHEKVRLSGPGESRPRVGHAGRESVRRHEDVSARTNYHRLKQPVEPFAPDDQEVHAIARDSSVVVLDYPIDRAKGRRGSLCRGGSIHRELTRHHAWSQRKGDDCQGGEREFVKSHEVTTEWGRS